MDDRIFYVKTYLKELLTKVKEQSLLNSKYKDALNKIINRINGSYYEEHLCAHDDVSDYVRKVFDDMYMFNVRDLQDINISDFREDEFKYIDFLQKCINIRLESFYSNFLLSVKKFVLKEALGIVPHSNLSEKAEDMENNICFIKLLTLEKSVCMVFNTKELYNVLNNYGNGNAYALIGHVFEFNSIVNILENQMQNSNDLNTVIENYKFISQYASKDERMETLEKARNNLANKIMQKYGVWGLDKKEVIKAFLDSPELKNAKDLEDMEIRKCMDNTGYVISNKNKNFIKLVSLNENIYDIPRFLVPVVRVFISKNLKKIPVYNNGKIKMLPINVNPEKLFGKSILDNEGVRVL